MRNTDCNKAPEGAVEVDLQNGKQVVLAIAVVAAMSCLLCAVTIIALRKHRPLYRDRFKIVAILLFVLTLLLTALCIF